MLTYIRDDLDVWWGQIDQDIHYMLSVFVSQWLGILCLIVHRVVSRYSGKSCWPSILYTKVNVIKKQLFSYEHLKSMRIKFKRNVTWTLTQAALGGNKSSLKAFKLYRRLTNDYQRHSSSEKLGGKTPKTVRGKLQGEHFVVIISFRASVSGLFFKGRICSQWGASSSPVRMNGPLI